MISSIGLLSRSMSRAVGTFLIEPPIAFFSDQVLYDFTHGIHPLGFMFDGISSFG